MAIEKKNKVGRPKVKGLERKISKTVSITARTCNVASKQFGTLGKAIEFAVSEKLAKSL